MSNTSALSRRVRLPIVVSMTLTAVCLGGVSAAPPSAAQNAEGCGEAPSRAPGIDELVAQRKAQMAAEYVALDLERPRASHRRN